MPLSVKLICSAFYDRLRSRRPFISGWIAARWPAECVSAIGIRCEFINGITTPNRSIHVHRGCPRHSIGTVRRSENCTFPIGPSKWIFVRWFHLMFGELLESESQGIIERGAIEWITWRFSVCRDALCARCRRTPNQYAQGTVRFSVSSRFRLILISFTLSNLRIKRNNNHN